MRATVSRSTGFIANKLMLGREVNKSADLLFGVEKANKIWQSPPDYVVRLEKILKEAHRVARENLKSSVLYNNVIMISDCTRLLTILVICVCTGPQ